MKTAPLKVYGVFELEHSPYGEHIWDGECYRTVEDTTPNYLITKVSKSVQ